MARALELATDVRTFGITEREAPKDLELEIRFYFKEMTKPEAREYIEEVKSSNRKLAGKLMVDYEELYANEP